MSMGYYNYLMPNMKDFNYTFSFLSSEQSQNLYVIIPTVNPPASSNLTSVVPKSLHNASLCTEEVLPDFNCKVCSATFPTYSEFKVHLETHNADASEASMKYASTNDIPVLSTGNPRKETVSILQPLKRGKSDDVFLCRYCPQTFKRQQEKSEHVLQHRVAENIQNTSLNNYLMPNMKDLNNTISFFAPEQNRNLYIIIPTINPSASSGLASSDPKSLRIASADTEEEILPDFRCKTCSAAFPTYSEFKTHLKMHSANAKEISMNSNSKKDTTVLKTEKHRKSNLPILQPLGYDKNGTIFRCPYCPQTFEFQRQQSEHVLQHRVTENIACVVCGSVFACISSLRKHLMMFHCKNKDRRQCTFCSYKCFQSSDLEKHIARKHTRDFKYKCSFCVKGFATPKELHNHERRKHLKVRVVPKL